VILEAMAAHLPVLTTPAGDAGRIVKVGTTGFLLKPDDPQGMADYIVNLIRNPALARQMGEAGRKQVEQDYNIKSLARGLLSIFSDFVCKRGKNSMAQDPRTPAVWRTPKIVQP
jgi:glycosyltransferase involved in cell wall biosynthesis